MVLNTRLMVDAPISGIGSTQKLVTKSPIYTPAWVYMGIYGYIWTRWRYIWVYMDTLAVYMGIYGHAGGIYG